MAQLNKDTYDERVIKEAEKRTERYRTEKRIKEIRQFINSKLFKGLDFPQDEEKLEN